MRIFAYVVAVLSFASCIGCMISVPKFKAIYEDLDAQLPILTQWVLTYNVLLTEGRRVALAALPV